MGDILTYFRRVERYLKAVYNELERLYDDTRDKDLLVAITRVQRMLQEVKDIRDDVEYWLEESGEYV